MQHWIILGIMAALLVGCGGAPAASDPPPAAPTAVATVVALDKIAIEPALIQSGDLGSQVTGGQVKELVPVLFKDVTQPLRVLNRWSVD